MVCRTGIGQRKWLPIEVRRPWKRGCDGARVLPGSGVRETRTGGTVARIRASRTSGHASPRGDFERMMMPITRDANADGRHEVHLLRFDAAGSFDAFRSDPELQRYTAVRDSAVERAELLKLAEVALPGHFGTPCRAAYPLRTCGLSGEDGAQLPSGAGVLLGDFLAHHVHVQGARLGQDLVECRRRQ